MKIAHLLIHSPAKVNLYLRVTGRREDGYHFLTSLVQVVSLFDTLTFEEASFDFFSCSHPAIPTDRRNLVLKALDLFREVTGSSRCYKIHLEKKIPFEAGLGGGSSNAASTLFALNQLHQSQLPLEKLSQMGFQLGADVPLFFSSGTAEVSGVGDKVVDAPHLFEKVEIGVVKPPFGLETSIVYRKLRELEIPFERGQTMYRNDLERAAFLVRPELEVIKRDLEESGFDRVVLCGSGSAFFCLGKGRPAIFNGFRLIQLKSINRPDLKQWYLPDEE